MKCIKTILGGIRKADQTFNLFEEKDKVMIGVSGGKDSMSLLFALNEYRKFKTVNFKIYPTILDLGFDGFDPEPIKKYVESLGLTLNVVDAKDVFPILSAHKKGDKLPCSICSRMKKAAINKAAKELGCNKVAFAHHADDALETLLMNAIYGSRIATFQPKMYLERSEITFIRPFILVHEDDIKALVKEESIPFYSSHCPNDGYTQRQETKEMLVKLYKKYPQAKDNFLTMLSNHKTEVLFHQDLDYKIERKNISLKPVISAKDAFIEMEIRRKLNALNFDNSLERFVIYKKDKAIGVISLKQIDEHSVLINDFKLLKENNELKAAVLRFVEFKISYKLIPLKMIYKGKDDKAFYKENSYKKIQSESGLSKLIG